MSVPVPVSVSVSGSGLLSFPSIQRPHSNPPPKHAVLPSTSREPDTDTKYLCLLSPFQIIASQELPYQTFPFRGLGHRLTGQHRTVVGWIAST